jgi:hypothetical protein
MTVVNSTCYFDKDGTYGRLRGLATRSSSYSVLSQSLVELCECAMVLNDFKGLSLSGSLALHLRAPPHDLQEDFLASSCPR